MAKQPAKQDMFGMGDDGSQGGDDAPYVILQIIPAEGWHAVFRDPDINMPTRILGLAGFALVEIFTEPVPGQPPMRAMRPMVATEHGEIEDVEAFEDFVCVVPPGGDREATIDYVGKHPIEPEEK